MATFDNTLDYDYKFALPNQDEMYFLAINTPDSPYQRALSQVLREQVDDQPEPGNSSLAGWWIRTQLDWSAGAGVEFQEKISTDEARKLRQYWKSAGVDPFTVPGELTLLPKPVKGTDITDATNSPYVVVVSDINGAFVCKGTDVVQYGWDGKKTTYSNSAGGQIYDITLAGDNLVTFTKVGIYTCKTVNPGQTPGAFTKKYDNDTGEFIAGTWVKSRVIAVRGPSIYELPDLAKGELTTLGNFSALSPFYTNPDPNYTWTSATTTPRSILVGGSGGISSDIYSITLDEKGDLPTTAAPVSIATFPANELVQELKSYLGAFCAIQTSVGVRIGVISDEGFIKYGPLLDCPTPSGRFVVWDRFVVYPTKDAGDGRSGLVKIDLSEIDETGRAAWSTFIRLPQGVAGTVVGSAIRGPRDVIMANVNGTAASIYSAIDATSARDTGWIDGGWIRYGTLEHKNFINLDVNRDFGDSGTVVVKLINEDLTVTTLGTMEDKDIDHTFQIERDPQTQAAVRLELAANGATDAGPRVTSWQVRSLVAPQYRSELVQYMLMNFDYEQDDRGSAIGYAGRAWSRYAAFRDAVRTGQTIKVTELRTPGPVIQNAVVQDLAFVQTADPTLSSGFGGTLKLTVRVL